jgi:hypothetical protein
MPARAELLGVVDGDTYVQMRDGHVWVWNGAKWKYFCTGETWPATATYAALDARERGVSIQDWWKGRR